MAKTQSVVTYFENLKQWKEELLLLRDICLDVALEESIKWGIPYYTLNGKNIAGIIGLKNHFAIWFDQGVFLKDNKKKLINANEEVTKGLRQWRFNSIDDIQPELIKEYLIEAITNEKAGKRIKAERNKPFEIPQELQEALNSDKLVNSKYKSLTPFKQKEFAAHVSQAKRESTRISRVEKIIPLILNGIGLHDKYRK